MKFTLVAVHDTGPKITYEFEAEVLSDVLTDIKMFLQGVGFHTGDEDLDFQPKKVSNPKGSAPFKMY